MSDPTRMEAETLYVKSTAGLERFGAAVGVFSTLIEQPKAVLSPEVRWWRGKGWDLVRTKDGHWLGFPEGKVQYPPLFAMASVSEPAQVFRYVIEDLSGFVSFGGHPHGNVFELRLVAFHRN